MVLDVNSLRLTVSEFTKIKLLLLEQPADNGIRRLRHLMEAIIRIAMDYAEFLGKTDSAVLPGLAALRIAYRKAYGWDVNDEVFEGNREMLEFVDKVLNTAKNHVKSRTKEALKSKL